MCICLDEVRDVRVMLVGVMGWMLARPATAMDAAAAACRLFVTSVLPGLFPYMTLSLMLVSRAGERVGPAALTLLGWCGGSPTGARLIRLCAMTHRERLRTAVTCATMSPMFLLGTVGGWLNSPLAGACVLLAVLLGGWIAGRLAGLTTRTDQGMVEAQGGSVSPMSLGESVESAARTMLMVCGTMIILRVAAALATEVTNAVLPALTLPLTTLLEVTTGARMMADLPLPLPLRTALIAGAAGFGGTAVMMQNRSAYPKGLMTLPRQALWQAVHGGVSFLIALGLMLLFA